MDLLFQTPNSVAMGSDFVQVPELDSEKPEENANLPSGLQEDSFQSAPNLPRPPPLIPAPASMEEVPDASCALVTSLTTITPPTSPRQQLNESQLNDFQVHTRALEIESLPPATTSMEDVMVAPPTPAVPITATTTGLQIMTRKRSSMSAASGTGSAIVTGYGTTTPAITSTSAVGTPQVLMEPPKEPAAIFSSEVPTGTQTTQPPPKKKKKYTPKPKKPTTSTTTGDQGASAAPLNLTKPKSRKKAPTQVSPPVPIIMDADGKVIQNPVPAAAKPSKSKKSCKPKAPKKPSVPGSGGSKSKSSSKKGKQVQPTVSSGGNNGDVQARGEGASGFQTSLVPPLRIHMPKLTKMISSTVHEDELVPMKMKIKNEPNDWDENGEQLDPMAETEMMEQDCSDDSGNGKGGLSRKKKSKGRNGNIYIGVFNRIEWMKLQNEFGFGSVNNFGTFVLQTMRRVHGDIQFWCDVAVASGVYPDLGRYEWTNGFPHAVNTAGQVFTPAADVTMSDEKRIEVIEMAKGMWDQRLLLLKQQQQQLTGEDDVDEVLLDAAVVEDAEDDDEEDDDVGMPGLENYLENMASGQYSPAVPAPLLAGFGGDGGMQPSTTTSPAGTAALTEEEVNKIWNEQMNDSDSFEKFGKLFNFINSIAAIGKMSKSVVVSEGGAGDGVITSEEEVVTLGGDTN